MLKQKKTKLSNWMMAISLLMLGTFLGFYLFSTYTTEKERIEREMGYVFTNSIQEIESKLMGSLIKITKKGDNNVSININSLPEKKVAVFSSKTELGKSGGKEIHFSNRIERRSIETKSDAKEVNGMLSVMLKVDRRSNKDSIIKLERFWSLESILPKIKTQFAANLAKGKLDANYTMVLDSLKPSQKIIAVYNDLPSNQKLWVLASQNFWIIFKNILPEILTTLLLFGFVALSFYLILQSDKKRQEMFQLKTDFISNMTHELKTPIATMSVALEAIERFDLQSVDKKMEYIGIARKEANKLSDLVDKVMQVSKMTQLEIKTKQEYFDLNALIREILSELEPRIVDRKIQVLFENSVEKCEVFSDLENLRIIIYNLIDNAIKYNETEDARIEISSKPNGKYVEVEILDNGKPIPLDFRDKIFEKFYRVPQSGQTHNIKGHGLGLYIVESLAKSIGGMIEYKALDMGNSFVLKNIQTNA
ncbi:sensor histidine kinase [Lacihabitans soyangensis]|uniref:histidine kinase n=1 Tax=Lacihabitans soyangensis TaxID=869394 RepID=A0AAE3H2L2_9BACT|nr:HAMP domain-containing sensor histidine kinase [Lacihabitans soyangensis]MCP9763802.1 sensor histidine kinase [Lacihabitans soyangensis]